MNVFALLLISTVMVLGCTKQQAMQTQSKNEKVPDRSTFSPDSFDGALTKLAEIPKDSYHRFLRSSSLLVPPVCVGKNWADVTDVLEKNETPSMKAWENGSAIHKHYLLQKDAIELSDTHSLDMWLLLSASPSQKIYAGDIALVSNFGAKYSDVIARAPYPEDSVLDRVLRFEDVEKAGKSWPFLKRIIIHYSYLHDRRSEYSPSGFHVIVEYCASLTGKVAGKELSFYVPSGLDPLRSLSGDISPNIEFTETDTLGDIMIGGGLEWWHGEPGVVETNKKKHPLPTANDDG